MLKSFSLIFLIFSLASCSNLSKNFTKKGDFYLRGGHFQNSKWSKSLKFDRYTWYHEVTMLYDMMLTKVDSDSPFYDWFSNSEKKLLASCTDFYLMLDYSLDSKKVSKKMVENDAKRSGFQKIVLRDFEKHLLNHPDVEELSLQLYETSGLCYRGEISNREKILVRLPGFTEVPVL
ncbi:MAG: hypothetical protein KC493_15835 [Bacteriovoracaceae bacterium]|nr:hypothetical protein [Bacteriovoracaceae bacterium]